MTKKKHENTEAPKADAKTARLISTWKKKYVVLKAMEPEVAALKAQVTAAVIAAGSNCLVSGLGTIALTTKKTVDWEGMARKFIAPDLIESNLQLFTSTSAPFVSAPREWTKESAVEAKKAA